MATIQKLKTGGYRAIIRHKSQFIKNKTFSKKHLADKWAADFEQRITKILALSPDQLKELTSSQIDTLGGTELFKKLGVMLPEVLTFGAVSNEMMLEWEGKDASFPLRVMFWIEHLGDKPLKSITPQDIRRILKKYKSDKTRNTQLRYKACISTIFRFAAEALYIDYDVNPARNVHIKPDPNEIVRYLDKSERKRLLNACKQSQWSKLYLLVLMAMSTGMRKSELLQLRWCDIDFDRQLAMLADSKNGDPLHCPIPSQAIEELKRHRKIGKSLIFASKDNNRKPYYFRYLWDTAVKKAKIENFRFHDLRHDFCSQLAMNGKSTHENRDLAGHRTIQTTQRYIHLSTAHKSEIIKDVMDKVLDL